LINLWFIFCPSANKQPKRLRRTPVHFEQEPLPKQEKTMTILKTLVIATALITSGTAFASEGGNDIATRQITDSRAAFSLKSTVSQEPVTTASIPRGVVSNVFTNSATFPVNTMNLSQGASK
jgi:hypothetical protein